MTKILLHIGFPKAGATYLHQWFNDNPAMFYKGKSIAGFSNTWELAAYAENEQNRHECFVLGCEDLSLWKGEMDISTLEGKNDFNIKGYQTRLADLLYSLFPHAVVLISTRGYEAMLLSLYKQNISIGGIYDLNGFLKKMQETLAGFYDYNFTIGLYRQRFGANALVLPIELLKDDTVKYISTIEGALGITPSPVSTSILNSSLSDELIYTYLKVSQTIYAALKLLPDPINKIIYRRYAEMLAASKPHWTMNFLKHIIHGDMELTIPDETLDLFKKNGSVLINEPLYQNYRKEYFLQ